MLAAEMPLILEIETDEFWQDVTLPMLETVRRRAFRAAHAFMRYARSAPIQPDL
jgi:type I restriction enzyme, R subunit